MTSGAPAMPADERRGLIPILAGLAAIAALSVDTYLPAMPAMAASLGASADEIEFSITGFLLGFAVGMLFYGPLSDRFGRRRVMIGGLLLYLVSTVGCALASDANELIAMRVLQAFGGGAVFVLSRAIVRDVFPRDQAARVLSQMHALTMIAPLLAPILGGYLAELFGWRSVFAFLGLFGLAALFAVLTRVPETYPPEQRHASSLASAFAGYLHVLRERESLAYLLCGALSFSAMYAYITGTPFVYIEYFGVAAEHYGYFFAANIASIMLATTLNARYLPKLGLDRLLLIGAVTTAVGGALVLLLGATGLGGLWALVAALMPVVAVTGLLGANCVARLLALHPERAGAAAASFGACQFGIGALASAAVGTLHSDTPLALCLVVGSCAIASLIALLTLGARRPTHL